MFNLLVEIEDLFSKEIIKSEYTYKFYELSDIPAGRYPLIDRRLDNLEKRTDEHDIEIKELVKISQSLANSIKVLNWVTGIVGAGVVSWIVTQILSLIR